MTAIMRKHFPGILKYQHMTITGGSTDTWIAAATNISQQRRIHHVNSSSRHTTITATKRYHHSSDKHKLPSQRSCSTVHTGINTPTSQRCQTHLRSQRQQPITITAVKTSLVNHQHGNQPIIAIAISTHQTAFITPHTCLSVPLPRFSRLLSRRDPGARLS